MLVLKILAEQLFINGDKMKRLVPNAVPITSNYEEITLWEEIIKISNDDTITGENLLVLKTNIEMRLGSKLQEMGWDLGNGENKLLVALVYNQTVSIVRNTAGHLKYYHLSVMSTVIFLSQRWF
jgi:hypothetical protein